MYTPWGHSDGQETLAEGIVSYSTPSHGGIHLTLERQKSIPADTKNFLGSFQWWEEDCDWAIPYYIFREDIRAYGNLPCIKKHMFVGRLCDILKAENKNFNKERFLEAAK